MATRERALHGGPAPTHLEGYSNIQALNDKSASILVVGAGFIGVEWVTELQHFFLKLALTIIDLLPYCLGTSSGEGREPHVPGTRPSTASSSLPNGV